MFHCSAFLLNIASELELAEFRCATFDTPDVQIVLAPVPSSLPEPAIHRATWQAKPDTFLIDIEGVARYLVTNGNKITIQIHAGATENAVRNFLLGSAFAALLQQRKLLTLHASAIETPKGAVLFSGRSGHGKSTLMSQFGQQGYTMISDDITAVELVDGQAVARPSFPRTRLTEMSITKLKLTQSYDRIGSSIEKYHVPVDVIASKPVPIHAVCFLDLTDVPEPTLDMMDRKSALRDVVRLTYRANFMKAMQLAPVQFEIASSVVQQSEFCTVTRVGNKRSFDQTFTLISEHLGI